MQDTERSECTTQEDPGILQDEPVAHQNLPLVTSGALLGIKLVSGHLKHVIALDANAVQDRTGDRLELR